MTTGARSGEHFKSEAQRERGVRKKRQNILSTLFVKDIFSIKLNKDFKPQI